MENLRRTVHPCELIYGTRFLSVGKFRLGGVPNLARRRRDVFLAHEELKIERSNVR